MNETDASGVSNRMKVWAHVKYECESTLKRNGHLRMPDGLQPAFYARLNANAYVTSTLSVAVEWLTIEIDESYDDAKDRHFRIADLMHTKIFVNKHMGGRSDFRMSRSLEMEVASALKASGLWQYHRSRTGPWRRTNKNVAQESKDAKERYDQMRDMEDAKRRGGFGSNAFGNEAPF